MRQKSLPRAGAIPSSRDKLGNTAAAHAGVAQATIVQLISWRIINSSAGRYALEVARFIRLTFSGSCCESNEGSLPVIASRAEPFGMPEPCLHRAKMGPRRSWRPGRSENAAVQFFVGQ